MKRTFFALFFLTFVSYFSFSQSKYTNVYKVYNLPSSARIAGLGGKSIAIPEPDINYATVNPSSLSDTMSNQFVMNFTNYLVGVNYGNIMWGYSLKERGNIALGIQYLDYGSEDMRDEFGYIQGSWRGKDYVFSLIWSKELFKYFNIGASVKPVVSQLDIYKSLGVAFDMGINFYNPKFGTMISAVVTNMGEQINPYIEGRYENFDYDIQLGISTKLKHAPFRFSFVFHSLNQLDLLLKNKNVSEPTNNSNLTPEELEVDYVNKIQEQFLRHLIFGVEIIPVKSFYFQIGYNYQQRSELKVINRQAATGFSFGAGISIKKMKISYARSNYYLSQGINHISLGINLNNMLK